MTIAVVAQTVLVIALLVVLEVRDRRAAAERDRMRADSVTPDLAALVELVDRLCQRIQAPEVAVAEHTSNTLPVHAPPAVAPDDDQAFWENKEQMAERLMAKELSNGAG